MLELNAFIGARSPRQICGEVVRDQSPAFKPTYVLFFLRVLRGYSTLEGYSDVLCT